MKIHVLSDLHLEFQEFEMPYVDADVLVLAGDIGTGLQGIKAAQEWSKKMPVIYVAGNHEYYNQLFPSHTSAMRLATVGYPNLHFLENEPCFLNGVRFLGCTLWTDFELYGLDQSIQSQMIASKNINDYYEINSSEDRTDRRLRPTDTLAAHVDSRIWLSRQLDKSYDGQTVVVTHHVPTEYAVHPRFRQRKDGLSPAFASNLESMFGPELSLWVSGHTHYNVDLDINGTRFVTNCRGYPDEMHVRDKEDSRFDEKKVIEI